MCVLRCGGLACSPRQLPLKFHPCGSQVLVDPARLTSLPASACLPWPADDIHISEKSISKLCLTQQVDALCAHPAGPVHGLLMYRV